MVDASSKAAAPTTRVIDRFARQYGHAPAFLVRAPGRVNLLGEHTDYNGLPVLPMAIDRNILIAAAGRDDYIVRLTNTAERFGPRTYEVSEAIAPFADGDWGNYSKAAAQGLWRYCGRPLNGADLLIEGDIPSGAGLSSSSALVVANALALLAANAIAIPYVTLAELLPVAERYVGTLSGGMDQSTSLLAQQGHALRIDFAPLRVRTVPLPAGFSIVVCHSLVQAEKSGAARRGYNLRVIECRLACRVLNAVIRTTSGHRLQLLGDLLTAFPGRALAEFIRPVADRLPDRALSLAEVAAIIGTDADRLRGECHILPELGDAFAVLRRLRHVLSEADRVEAAEAALRGGDAAGFGQLMDASHSSCRDDYQISCPELEHLVQIAKKAGALGARLTGAGFGGCTVSLVADDDVPAFLRQMDESFYRPRATRAEDCQFIFKPQCGAEVRSL